jgi:hypothetical protein
MENYKMENVTYVEILNPNTQEIMDYAIIDRGNNEFTSMPKAVYEAQQVDHLTEIPTPDEA